VYAGFALHKDDITTQEQETLDVAATTVATNIHDRLQERKGLVTLTSGEPAAAAHGTGEQRRLVERFVNRTAFNGASVVDADGRLRVIESENVDKQQERALIGSDLSDREYVQRALAGETFVDNPLAAETGNEIVTISTPIIENGTVVGIFNGALHLSDTRFFGPTHNLFGETLTVAVRSDSPLYESGTVAGNALTANATVTETGWTVVATQDRSNLDQQLWLSTVAQIAAIVLVLLSVALIGIWFSRTTLSSLDELIGGLTQLQDGEYETELDIDATDEWVQISSQFNTLAAALDERESQLRVLNRVLRHNLRNDMSVIIAYSDAMLHSDADEPTKARVRKVRRTAHNLIETSEHAQTIYDEMLDGENRQRRPADIVTVVERAAVRLRSDFPGSTVETQLPEQAWALDGDSVSIIMDELCRNALMHNDWPEEDRMVILAVEGGVDDGEVRLTISDNGPGLPEFERDLLTGEIEGTSIEHGSGLGLWVVSWLVDHLDGSLSITYRDERGTSITVTIPASEKIPENAEAESQISGKQT